MGDELDALSVRVGEALAAGGLMLATAESCTGGWIAQVVTATAGSSGWFDRGFVTYSNAAKRDMLGVRDATLEAHGAVSEPVVREMAAGALARGEAAIAVSVSGVAGPGGGSEAKPVGTVCIGWAMAGADPESVTRLYAGDRTAIRRATVVDALEGVIARVAGRS